MKRQHTYDQHFLRSPRLVAELIGHSNIRKNDTVYDLGAGSGVIASVLARRVKRVIAVENEPNTLKLLTKNLHQAENVEVVRSDIMSVLFPSDSSYKIFSNIPFSLSSELVTHLTSLEHPPKAIYLIVQKQFARKLMVDDDNFTSQLGMRIAPWWSVRIRRPLKKTDFWPHPAIDTVLLEIKPREEPLLSVNQRTSYERFVTRVFENPQYLSTITKHGSLPASRHTAVQLVQIFEATSQV